MFRPMGDCRESKVGQQCQVVRQSVYSKELLFVTQCDSKTGLPRLFTAHVLIWAKHRENTREQTFYDDNCNKSISAYISAAVLSGSEYARVKG